MHNRIKIGYKGVGRYLPKNILTNAHLEHIVDTSDEWIRQRTGIQKRHIMDSSDSLTSMAIKASKDAIDHAGIDPSEISVIRIGVNTHLSFPSLAALVQEGLGIPDASASDISAGCAGFIYAAEDIYSRLNAEWMMSGQKSYGLAIGIDALSLVTDYTDRQTCVLFGDGAGAAIIGPVDSGEILATYTRTQGKYGDLLYLQEFLSEPLNDTERMTFRHKTTTNYPYLQMAGPKVFVVAVRTMVEDAKRVISKYNQVNGSKINLSDIEYVIPHQANLRIVSAVGDALKLPQDKVYRDGVINFGNTSAATIVLAYVDEWGKRPGALEVDVAFGAGFASGAILRRVANSNN